MWYADDDDDLNIKQSHSHAPEPSQSAPSKVFLGYVHCWPVQHQHKSSKLCDTRNTVSKNEKYGLQNQINTYYRNIIIVAGQCNTNINPQNYVTLEIQLTKKRNIVYRIRNIPNRKITIIAGQCNTNINPQNYVTLEIQLTRKEKYDFSESEKYILQIYHHHCWPAKILKIMWH